jgi:hypothetical protein
MERSGRNPGLQRLSAIVPARFVSDDNFSLIDERAESTLEAFRGRRVWAGAQMQICCIAEIPWDERASRGDEA